MWSRVGTFFHLAQKKSPRNYAGGFQLAAPATFNPPPRPGADYLLRCLLVIDCIAEIHGAEERIAV
jgi:hypothetical protein